MLLDNSFQSDARVEKEAKTLISHGAHVTVFCIKDDDLPAHEQRDGYGIVRCIEHGYNAPLRKSYKDFVATTVKKILEESFDVLHCHDFYMLSIGAEVKKKRPSVILIYDAHEYLAGWPFYKTSEGLNKWKGKLVWNKLIRKEKAEILHADAVLTITDSISDRLKSKYNLKKKPSVLGNYPSKFELKKNDRYFQDKYKLKKETKIIIHSGTIYHADDQLALLFDVLKQHDDLGLIFVGNRPRFYEIEAMVQLDESLQQKVFFHPYPDRQEEVINLLASADIGLLHIIDKWEAHTIGFSNRFVEYSVAELPVVATPQNFTREINNEYHCATFYSTQDNTSLNQAIERLLNDYDAFKQGAMKAGKNMHWDSVSQTLVNLYAALTA